MWNSSLMRPTVVQTSRWTLAICFIFFLSFEKKIIRMYLNADLVALLNHVGCSTPDSKEP